MKKNTFTLNRPRASSSAAPENEHYMDFNQGPAIASAVINQGEYSDDFYYSRRLSIEELEAQLHDRAFTMVSLKFSGLPGFSAHEQVLIRQAMTELIENSARTVIACVLENVRASDAYHTIGEYFRNRKDLAEQKICNNSSTMSLINKLHNLVTDPTHIIEFIDNRAPPAFYRQLKKQQREEIRAEIFEKTPLLTMPSSERETLKVSLVQAFGRRNLGGFNKRSWRNILASDGSYDSDYDDNSPEEQIGGHRDKIFLTTTEHRRNTVAIDADLLHFSNNSPDRGYMIYRALAAAITYFEGRVYAIDLYKYVLDAYDGVLQERDADPYCNYSKEGDDGL